MKAEWQPDMVLARLVDAYRVVNAIGRVDWPKEYSSAMPAPSGLTSAEEIYKFQMDDLLTNHGRAFRRYLRDRQKATQRAAERIVSIDRITAAESAIHWPALIESEQKRSCLVQFATCKAHNRRWGKWLMVRNKKVPAGDGWAKRTTYRWIDQTLSDLAHKLAEKGEPVKKIGSDLPSGTKSRKKACKSDKVVSNAWMAEGARPSDFRAEK